LVMGSAFSFSTFASDLGRELKAGSGSISFIFGCAMALLYAGGLFSGALADRIGTHRVAGAGALLAGGSLVAAGARSGGFGKPMSRSGWALASVWRSATRPPLRLCNPGSTAIGGLRRESPCLVPGSVRS
jgi:MFS family permease